jgi:hypothetical protein
MDMLVARHVFYEAMNEDDGAARGTRRRVVCAGIEGSRLGTGKPGFGEVGHGCVRIGSGGHNTGVVCLVLKTFDG